jgi:hypothetical protein
MKSTCLVASIFLILVLIDDRLESVQANLSIPDVDFSHIDPVDMCLFTCSMCYEREELLECANKACLGKHVRGRLSFQISSAQKDGRGCPGLDNLQRRRK